MSALLHAGPYADRFSGAAPVLMSVAGVCIAHSLSADCADTAKSGELLQQIFGGSLEAPVTVYSVGFCGLLAAMCYGLRPAQLDKANAGLLAAVFLSFAVRPPISTCPSHPGLYVSAWPILQRLASGDFYLRHSQDQEWLHAGPCLGSI